MDSKSIQLKVGDTAYIVFKNKVEEVLINDRAYYGTSWCLDIPRLKSAGQIYRDKSSVYPSAQECAKGHLEQLSKNTAKAKQAMERSIQKSEKFAKMNAELLSE